MIVEALKTPPDEDTISTLERMLELAKAGKIVALVACALNPGGATDHILVGHMDYRSQALALMDMQWQLMQRRYNNCITESESET